MPKGKAPKNAFKKGKSGNPSGRPKTPPDILEIRKMNNAEVTRMLNKFSNCTRKELEQMQSDPNTMALDLIIIKIMLEGMRSGSLSHLNFVLERMVGKTPDKIEHSGQLENNGTVHVTMSVLERINQLKSQK